MGNTQDTICVKEAIWRDDDDSIRSRACAPETVPLTMMLDEIAKHKEEMSKLR